MLIQFLQKDGVFLQFLLMAGVDLKKENHQNILHFFTSFENQIEWSWHYTLLLLSFLLIPLSNLFVLSALHLCWNIAVCFPQFLFLHDETFPGHFKMIVWYYNNHINIFYLSQQFISQADPTKSDSPTVCELQQDGRIWTVPSDQET